MLCLFDSRSSDQLQFSFYANIRCPNQVMMEYFLANRNFICSYLRILRGTTHLQEHISSETIHIYMVSVLESHCESGKIQ